MDGRDTSAGIWSKMDEIKDLIRSLESEIHSGPSPQRSEDFSTTFRSIRAKLSDIEAELAHMQDNGNAPSPDVASLKQDIADRRRRLAEIDKEYDNAATARERNNLEVSKRFLQMEINSLLIRLAESEKGIKPGSEEAEIEELKRDIAGRIRVIDSLREELARTKEELAIANARLGRPEDRAMCDTTRVSVEAGRLREMDSRIRTLGAENHDLRAETNSLKRELDLMKRNVRELAMHCDISDRQVLELQSRIRVLRESADAAARNRDEAR